MNEHAFMSESIGELVSVFDRHNVDRSDLAVILYMAGKYAAKATIIYRPSNQVLSDINQPVSALYANQLLEEARQGFMNSGFGIVRMAPPQEADGPFLTLDSLKLRVVSGGAA